MTLDPTDPAFHLDLIRRREAACEASLQHGKYGVVEIWNEDGTVTFGLHPSVPYGEIHEYPWGVEGHPSMRGETA